MVDTHRNPSPKENGLNTQKQGHSFFFLKKIILFHSLSSEEVIFPHRYSETAHSKRTAVLWPVWSFIHQLEVRVSGSWSATEKQQNDFGFGIVRFIFYLKLARLQ